jgi:hypothetical protein
MQGDGALDPVGSSANLFENVGTVQDGMRRSLAQPVVVVDIGGWRSAARRARGEIKSSRISASTTAVDGGEQRVIEDL